jgi:hypothetical protein
MIELSVVKGIWPSPASKAPVRKSVHEGTNVLRCHMAKEGALCHPAIMAEIMRPSRKIRSAYGTLGSFCVERRARKAKMAQMRLSPAFGVIHPNGCNREVPAEMTRERPAPTCIPFTTGVGTTCVNQRSRPVTLKMKTTPAVVKPAETVSSIVNFLTIATAAIAYEGVRSRETIDSEEKALPSWVAREAEFQRLLR